MLFRQERRKLENGDRLVDEAMKRSVPLPVEPKKETPAPRPQTMPTPKPRQLQSSERPLIRGI